MLELGIGADLVRGIGLVLWGLLAAALLVALLKPKTITGKVLCSLLVLGIFFGPMVPGAIAAHEYRQKYEKAKALFDERCKTAGEKIYRTVENVEGVFILRPRTEELNYSDQFKLDDPYGYAGTGENYLKLFVRGRTTVPAKTGEIIESSKVVTYKFVEVIDETGKGFYRYTTSSPKDESERFTRNGGGVVELLKTATQDRKAKYGINWSDISTDMDRKNWIAGSSLKIIDLLTNEVIAERIGYMFDKGLGDKSGGRSPWSAARDNACPLLNEKTFYFFDRVIKPIGEKSK